MLPEEGPAVEGKAKLVMELEAVSNRRSVSRNLSLSSQAFLPRRWLLIVADCAVVEVCQVATGALEVDRILLQPPVHLVKNLVEP